MKTNKIVCALLLIAAAIPAKAIKADPFLTAFGNPNSDGSYNITSVEDWKALAEIVKSGNTCQGKTFKLTQDIGPISNRKVNNVYPVATIGYQTGSGSNTRKRFAGTFDGCNHSITVDLVEAENNKNYTAPFAYTDMGVTIKNLTVKGTISSNGCYSGGIIGSSADSDKTTYTVIENCTVSATIISRFKSSGNANANQSGFVGIAEAPIQINNSIFNGEFKVADGGDFKHSGGFVALAKSAAKFNNCLFNPKSIEGDTYRCQSFAHKSADQGSEAGTGTGLYCVTKFDDNVGNRNTITYITPSLQVGETGTQVTVFGVNYYKYTVNNFELNGNPVEVNGQPWYMLTFYHTHSGFQIPAGCEVMVMDSTYKLYALGDGTQVPMNCPVIILSKNQKVSFTKTTPSVTCPSNNALLGASENCTTPSGNVYVLGPNGNTFGLVKYEGSTLSKNKVYFIE